MYNCRKCGKLIDDNINTCVYCGTPREVTTVSLENSNVSASDKKNKTGLYIAVIVAALLVAIVAVVGVLIYNGTIDIDELFSDNEESSYDDSEYSEYLEKADNYAKKNKYDEALAVLDTAEEKIGESEELTAKRLEIKKAQIIYMCERYAKGEDYRKAFLYVYDNMGSFTEDADILEIKNLYTIKYYNMMLEYRCVYGDSTDDIIRAIDFIKEALRYFPEDAKLLEILKSNNDILSKTNESELIEIETAPMGIGTIDDGDIEIESDVMPATTVDIINFYTAGIKAVKNNGAAGYTKKEWQNVDAFNIGSEQINDAVTGVLGNFMTFEADASEQICEKGSADAMSRFPDWTLTDINMIASAECKDNGDGNYKITIIMKDEDTPKRSGSFLGKVTNSILYWEDIDNTLSTDGAVTAILNSYDNIHVVYKNYTISAVMTPDGKFVSLDHTADVDILIGNATILFVFKIENKSGHMWNYCKYYDFKY